MQWNNFIVLIFILYMFILPLYICFDKVITEQNINSLIIFDLLFMIDRSADLFVGSYKLDGQPETWLWAIIQKNYEHKFILEIIVSIGPFFLNTTDLNSLVYAAFKIPRYIRLFELDSQIQEIVEYLEGTRSYNERKSIERTLDVLKFFTSKTIILHFFTCIMIVLC